MDRDNSRQSLFLVHTESCPLSLLRLVRLSACPLSRLATGLVRFSVLSACPLVPVPLSLVPTDFVPCPDCLTVGSTVHDPLVLVVCGKGPTVKPTCPLVPVGTCLCCPWSLLALVSVPLVETTCPLSLGLGPLSLVPWSLGPLSLGLVPCGVTIFNFLCVVQTSPCRGWWKGET